MAYVKVGPRHQITIPLEVREAAGIGSGDLLEIEARRGRVVITPQQVVAKPAAAKLSDQEQEALLSARQKIRAIQQDMPSSVGLSRQEADVAARIGIIAADQRWWWLEEWQEGEREAEADLRHGRVETVGSPDEFVKALESL